MPLTKTTGNMYPWCDFTHTHLGGECSHKCTYCYVQAMERRFKSGRYTGPLTLIEKEFRVNYGEGRTIFIEHCNDLFAADVPELIIRKVLDHCSCYPRNTYVFQTKNPKRYADFRDLLPDYRILGCTIETDIAMITDEVSKAPHPYFRAESMNERWKEGEKTFITIEPIMACNPVAFSKLIEHCHPSFVNIGADSKGIGLVEPSGADVEMLIALLLSLIHI